MTRTIDLNADIGEHDGDRFADDAAILDVVSSANIACGAHAGSADVMRQTIRAALERGVSVGAHPGYPDREGFGRHELHMTLRDILDSFTEQLFSIAECCKVEGATLRYVKPHGAMYNRASHEPELAAVIADATHRFDSSLFLLALSGSELEKAGRFRGLRVAREAFIDRAYMSDGTLVPRQSVGGVIRNATVAAERAVSIAVNQKVESIDGYLVSIIADSLCVHGDGANALETVSVARSRLQESGFEIKRFA
ncbi:MAG TPA: 5-oxoprolinase subunit PxpA [Gemmatimonadaceae bacterium]|nr:5-oxoprolinase subunit PxpA [Gemmatimonadaceae bacterium]